MAVDCCTDQFNFGFVWDLGAISSIIEGVNGVSFVMFIGIGRRIGWLEGWIAIWVGRIGILLLEVWWWGRHGEVIGRGLQWYCLVVNYEYALINCNSVIISIRTRIEYRQ